MAGIIYGMASSGALAEDGATEIFKYEQLLARAAEMASGPFRAPALADADVLRSLTYDQYRSIRFKDSASIWRGENRGFSIDFFHPGFIFDTPVKINLVADGLSRPVHFNGDDFVYGSDVPLIDRNGDFGYAGFRVRAPINKPDYLDEFLVFQGASYFRAVAKNQFYGLSARGLAIRTARPEGEEFPVFREFWIERPSLHANKITVYALLDSPSVVGAYRFDVTPGVETRMDVSMTLFPRRELVHVGIAPLTSMFLFDASDRSRFDDYRSAVHDSDGLEILNGNGERLWRQLANPGTLQVSAFLDTDPKGFGLVQRKRKFEDYQDMEARYDRRPSLWVEPLGSWGRGDVELVEIPSDREIHDNIVAYWKPSVPLPAGAPAEFKYRLRWNAEPLDQSLARVVATRAGKANFSEAREFVVDFKSTSPVPDNLQIELISSSGATLSVHGDKLETVGAYRAAFEMEDKIREPVELRLRLLSNGVPWSETWLYRWTK